MGIKYEIHSASAYEEGIKQTLHKLYIVKILDLHCHCKVVPVIDTQIKEEKHRGRRAGITYSAGRSVHAHRGPDMNIACVQEWRKK